MAFRHVVLFRVHDQVPPERVDTAIGRLESLAELPMVDSLVIARSLDARKGRVIVEEAMFTDAAAFAAFRQAPAHVEVANEMRAIADWWIGDYQIA